MKILFLSSGYKGAYPYIEESLTKAFQQHSITLCKKQCVSTLDELRLKQHCIAEKPDMIFTLLGYQLHESFLQWSKDQHIRVVIWLTEDPYMSDLSLKVAPYASHVVTIEKKAHLYYESLGYKSLHLPLGADYSIFKPMVPQPTKKSDLCFIGYPYPERVKLIKLLAKKLPITITVAGNWYQHSLPKNVHKAALWLTPTQTAEYYSSTKIVLNSYRRLSQPENKNERALEGISPNNRVFEVAGCKVCQISEAREDWTSWFREKDIALFSSGDELIEKVEHLLQAPDQRELYATNSYQTAVANHSYAHRVNTLLEWLTH
ncbi:CgeB family protein [Alkalicoccobacillus murimartini]|uniref:Spore maturation protein CgeB n=1 Tax=Alkalicoccobacillus murimartini TaxID=171685 RepID=A0ABT9YJ39_9BACI|nr:glycosyltransferase [Alkalicoccobacillus murimartini]MDQ0207873.1 spore maturation protein CgeB [Alkalicoccobacillus murimartini]